MGGGIKLTDCKNGVIRNVKVSGDVPTAVLLQNTSNCRIEGLTTNQNAGPRTFKQKVGRNEACPCGSGEKYKRCCGGFENMSTGIRSTDSQFVVRKANIVADVGIDLVRSKAKIDELNHASPTAPDLESVLKAMTVRPPEELVQSALEQAKNEGTTEGLSYTKLKQWCDTQGVNAGMWMQLVAAIGIAVFGG
ncbi:SEC-C domain-containing protein [Pseudomonas putida]|nr:SEC-C domain-containing protein [Pseudomonas putida]